MTGMKGSDTKSKHLYICFPQADKSPSLMLDWCSIFKTSIHILKQNHQYTNHHFGDDRSYAIKKRQTEGKMSQIINYFRLLTKQPFVAPLARSYLT